jgi:EAL domain-containing protein (putative c-di-GMP-specific phosphodiesterase class I)
VGAAAEPGDGAEGDALEAAPHPPVAHLIDRRGRCRLVYEPIADLARGTICGYEARERFPGAMAPDAWRVEALRRGLQPDFDAFVVGSVLHARESLPDGCFLAFNTRPATLLREAVRRVLAQADRLDGLVIELVPRLGRRDESRFVSCVAEWREAGARFAVDHIGGEDGVLRHAALVRPELAKLEGALVADLDRTPDKRALLYEIERIASRFGTALVARGVTRVEELEALMRLRVPFAQGPLIGVHAKTLTPIAFALSRFVRERGAAMLEPGSLAPLVERAPAPAGREPAAADESFRLTDGLAAAAQRALLRPAERRFDPLICCDANGDYVGVVPFERLVEALVHAADRPGGPDG